MVEGSPDPVVRPYTPISTNAMVGKFQLCVKVYPDGKVSQHMAKMEVGTDMDFKHIDKNVKVQYPFKKKGIIMLVGGTGITPMVQALHALLGTAGDETQVSLIFGNKTQADILCKDVLDKWADDFKERFKVVHVLSDAAGDDTWSGAKGFITADIIAQSGMDKFAPEDVMAFVCGPPPMYNALCGPRDKPEELTGILSEMGFTAERVFKF
jgi:cytochrome-b5 reductase